MRMNAFSAGFGLRQLTQKIREFREDDRGVMVIFTVYLLVAMMLITGLSIDVARTERMRTKIQNAIDRAVLAATNLDDTRDPVEIAYDHMVKAGLGDYISKSDIVVTSVDGSRSVSATASAKVPSLFLDMVGIDFMIAPAAAAAEESATNFEIILVLDVSGSMVQRGSTKLADLKRAAVQFVNDVLSTETAQNKISIGIVPYNGQVRVHPEILSHFNLVNDDGDEITTNNTLYDPNHRYSQCVLFRQADFETTAMTPDLPLGGASDLTYFDMFSPWGSSRTMDTPYCGNMEEQTIILPTNNPATLATAINALEAEGNTSIDYGMKWGTALIDPSFKPVMTSLAGSGEVPDIMDGRPYDYSEGGTRKVIVVMSDGENTPQYRINPDFRTGPSNIWANDNNSRVTSLHNGRIYAAGSQWPRGSHYSGTRQLDWAEVWNRFDVQWVATNLYAPPLRQSPWGNYKRFISSGRWASGREAIGTIADDFDTKDDRTSAICSAAKAQSTTLTIYAIAFQSGERGQDTLQDCATLPNEPFYQYVDSGAELQDTFKAISRDITKLRLTQ